MTTFLIVSNIILWVAVLFLAFLLMGTIRSLGLLTWRLEQFETTTPRKVGRDGLKKGTVAPEFRLPTTTGETLVLSEYAGRKRMLVFSQLGCSPCHTIVPELNRLQQKGEVQVLGIINSDEDGTREWVAETKARFPVAFQKDFEVSKTYQVFATPFAFYIDELGTIIAKGIITEGQHLSYLLRGNTARPDHTVVKVDKVEVIDEAGAPA